MRNREEVFDFTRSSVFVTPAVELRDPIAETTLPAVMDLRRCGPSREAVQAIIDATPAHLHRALVIAAANRGLVPAETVATLLEVMGAAALRNELGPMIAMNMALRFLPKGHEIAKAMKR